MTDALDWTSYQAAFRAAAEASGFSAAVLTEFDAGPMIAWQRPANCPRVYLSAGIHGDEPAGPLAILELLRGGFFNQDIQWSICPTLNPSGLAAGTRENAERVDLNRDYWLRGSREVIAHAAWIDAMDIPDLFVSLHEDWETEGFYFYEINLGKDRPDRARQILDAVSPWFAPEAGPLVDGHEVREDGWIYHEAEADVPEGWPEAIFLAKKGCPLSFTFETPSRAPLYQRVAAHAAAVRAACDSLSR